MMAMSSATLATQLLAMEPTASEATAIQRLADAYAVFAAGAQAAGPITAAGVALGKAAMITNLAGMSTPDQGASKMGGAMLAFWQAVAAGLSTSFAGATAIVAPPHSGMASSLASSFASNTSGGVSLSAAMNTIAGIFATAATTGGSVTIGMVTTPIT